MRKILAISLFFGVSFGACPQKALNETREAKAVTLTTAEAVTGVDVRIGAGECQAALSDGRLALALEPLACALLAL